MPLSKNLSEFKIVSFAKDSNCHRPSDESFLKAKLPQFTYPQRVSLSWFLNGTSPVSFRGRHLSGIRLRNIKLPFNPVKSSKTFPRASGLESPRSVGLHGIFKLDTVFFISIFFRHPIFFLHPLLHPRDFVDSASFLEFFIFYSLSRMIVISN